ncbi:unnamed protein product [Polarella glacialis]|uniref:Transmembrane protein n=1 Tax=Polarella glacialis TaxID=89957 RepID=A0A813K5W7_POLGL|nr:unnamed protein product [Polarella glacialis]
MPFSFPEGAMAEGNRDREEGPEKFDKQMIRAVRRVLQQELQEIRDLLVSLTENQRGIIERNQSEQSEPKLAVSLPRLSTPGNPRSARPCFSPQGTSSLLGDQRKPVKPVTIDQLEEQLAEHLQAAELVVGTSRALPAKQCPASLEEQTRWSRVTSGPSQVRGASRGASSFANSRALPAKQCPASLEGQTSWSRSISGPSQVGVADSSATSRALPAEQCPASLEGQTSWSRSISGPSQVGVADTSATSRALPAKQCPPSQEVQQTRGSRNTSGPSQVQAPVAFGALACLDSAAPCENLGVRAFATPSSPEEPRDLPNAWRRAPAEDPDALSGGCCRRDIPGQASPSSECGGPDRGFINPPSLIHTPLALDMDLVEEGHQRPQQKDSSPVLQPAALTAPETPCLQQLAILPPEPCRMAAEYQSERGKHIVFSTIREEGSARPPVTPSAGSTKRRTMDRLWATCDEQRVQGQDSDGKPESAVHAGASLSRYQRCLSSSSQAVFCIFGILPMRKGRSGYLYPAVVQLAILAIAAYLIFIHESARSSLWSEYNNALECLGVVMALCSFHWKRIKILLGPDRNLLKMYASGHGFYDHWVSTLPFDFLVACVFLAFEFAIPEGLYLYKLRTQGLECVSVPSSSHRLCHTVGALAFSVVMFFKMHVVSCLDLMIDDFSSKYAEHGLAQEGVLQWNLLQATMNSAAKRLEGSFVILFAATFAGFATVAADLLLGSVNELAHSALPDCSEGQFIWLLELEPLQMRPGGILAVHAGSGLTEKCIRTRCFVNSLVLDNCVLDAERSYLVRYIDDSAAGFYIQGVRLTGIAIMKMFYGMCALTFAISVQASRDSQTASSSVSGGI